MKKTLIIFLLTIVLFSSDAISKGYGYFDTSDDEKNEVLDIGYWDFVALLVGPDFASKLSIYVDGEINQNPGSNLENIYTQSNIINNELATIPGIDIFGYTWDFEAKGKTNNLDTIGYPVLIDRSTDEFGIEIHDISPSYSTSLLYPEYNYFTAYDALNLYTNNLYSLRLNYNTAMSTTTTVGQVSNVSFYAMSGLSDSDDLEDIRRARIYVYVSDDGSDWTRIGYERSNIVDSDSEYFDYYSFDVPSNMLGEELYVQIFFAGQTFNAGYSRLIIDELIITTIN